ncbi:MAG TPA: DUF4112 domain-containing protein, partial [Thermosynechococcaceae cyanobacterium]
QRLRTLTHVLDKSISIPGTRHRIGIDPLLGLLPGGGDVAGAVLSAYIVLSAAQFGLPKETLVRMLSNLLLDMVLGALPFLGDFFDATWKANSRNLDLLEAHVKNPRPQKAADRTFLVFLVIALALIVIGTGAIAVFLVSFLFNTISR